MKSILFRIIIAASTLLGAVLPAVPVHAAGPSLSMVANRSTVPNGGSLIVALYANGGGNPVNAVQFDVAYPASKLLYVGFSASGSGFEIGAASGGGDGLATVARGTTGAITGSALVGTMTFKALVGSGSAALSVAGSSSLVSNGSAVPYYGAGTSVNFGAVAAAPTAAAAPAPPKDSTAPVITAIKTKDVTPFSATITWTTSEPADSVVEYGLDATYGLSASSSTQTTTHSVNLSSAFLTPQSVMHFRVKSTDGAGNATAGTDQTLELPGVPVTIIVRGSDGKPQPGVSVTLGSDSGVTDAKGTVVLRAGLGNQKITTHYEGVTVQKPITVAKSTKPLPPVQLDLSKQPLNGWMLTSIGLFVIVLTLIGIDGFLFGSRFLAKFSGLHFRRPRLNLALGKVAHHAAVAAPPAPPAPPAPEEPVAPPVAKVPEPVPAPKPAPAPEPVPDELADPELDLHKTVAELMGDTVESVRAPAPNAPPVKPINISHFGTASKPAEPIKIELKPLAEPSPIPPPPSAPAVTKIDVSHEAPTPPAVVKAKKPAVPKSTKPKAKKAIKQKKKA